MMPSHRKVLIVFELERVAMAVLKCLRPLGARVHALAGSRRTMVRFSRYVERFTAFDPPRPGEDPAAFVDWAEAYVAEHGIDMIVPVDVPSAHLVHALRQPLGHERVFPMSDPGLLDTLADKWSFKGLLDELGIHQPRTELLSAPTEIATDRIAKLPYPVLLKPLAGYGSVGIVPIESHAALQQRFAHDPAPDTLPMVIQEQLPGTDVSIGILARDGRLLAWTIYHSEPEQLARRPRVLDFVEDAGVLEIARRIVAETGYTGIANFDLRIDGRDGGIVVLECNPRPWVTMAIVMWHGINFIELGMALASGKLPPAPPVCRTGRYLPHREILQQVALKPWRMGRFSRANRRGLWQDLSDPLPLIYSKLRGRFGRG